MRAVTSPIPTDPIERTRHLVRRSAPNPYRPRLSDEDELAFAEVDSRAAAAYAEIEDVTDRMQRLVEDLSSSDIEIALDEDDMTPDMETDR